ncbi:hypothetical protein AB6A40_004784 [Gnathostoma spinigerum]|uniref:DNA polymerase alpha subunit B n=1 Tax=Gnathostoma spinigerum TaxID=75299 RepID=A0ABD6EP98_9BILA
MGPGESIGEIDTEWFENELSDFMYTFENDEDGEFLSKVNHLSKVYSLTGDDLVSEIIAYATNIGKTHLDFPFLDLFEQSVLLKKVHQVTDDVHLFRPDYSDREILRERSLNVTNFDDSDLDGMKMSHRNDSTNGGKNLELKYARFTPYTFATSNETYQQRKNRSVTIASFVGKFFVQCGSGKDYSTKVEIESPYPDLDSSSLIGYGNEKEVEQINEICSRIDMLSDAIKSGNKLISNFEKCNILSSAPFFICGELYVDSEEALDAASWYLQSSDDDGTTISLDLSRLKSYSLFPGKVVGFQGTNENGIEFVPTAIYEPELLPLASFLPQNGIDNLKIWFAAGPFTSSATPSYEQLYDLLSAAAQEKPHVLILLGPFIDGTSQMKYAKFLEMSDADLFETLLWRMHDLVESSGVQLIIMPSAQKDVCALPLFPSPPFGISASYLNHMKDNIRFVPDPCHIRIGGAMFSITNSNILAHLGRQELCVEANGDNDLHEDRITRLARHLIRQRSLYPLSPPLDLAHSPARLINHATLREIPHFMLLPSVLSPLAKVVDGCVCINPGFLVRGSGGSYSKIEIDLTSFNTEANKPFERCSLAEYSSVSVVRI